MTTCAHGHCRPGCSPCLPTRSLRTENAPAQLFMALAWESRPERLQAPSSAPASPPGQALRSGSDTLAHPRPPQAPQVGRMPQGLSPKSPVGDNAVVVQREGMCVSPKSGFHKTPLLSREEYVCLEKRIYSVCEYIWEPFSLTGLLTAAPCTCLTGVHSFTRHICLSPVFCHTPVSKHRSLRKDFGCAGGTQASPQTEPEQKPEMRGQKPRMLLSEPDVPALGRWTSTLTGWAGLATKLRTEP